MSCVVLPGSKAAKNDDCDDTRSQNDGDKNESIDMNMSDATTRKKKVWTAAEGTTHSRQAFVFRRLLLQFHNQAQDEMQLLTNSLAKWNEEIHSELEEIIKWRDSFDRNGLAE